MGNVAIQKMEYKGWKNCIFVSNGWVDAILTTDVGPRIIHFGFTGKENEFCVKEEEAGQSGGDEWRIYGGHRLWHSPESRPRSYEPDNAPVSYKIIRSGVRLMQPLEPWTQMKKEIDFILIPDKAKARVIHRITNHSPWEVQLSAWALSVMAPGGREIIPENDTPTDLLPNRSLTLWPYTRMGDQRLCWGDRYIFLDQDEAVKAPVKIGLPVEKGWAAYANHGHLFVKTFKHLSGCPYPDNGCSYETYTTDFMLEMETLSPLTLLRSGDTLEHTETWTLFDRVDRPVSESDVDRYIQDLIHKEQIHGGFS